MMWPKIRYPSDGDLLAANNNIGKNAYYEDDVAEKLGNILLENYPLLLQNRYKLERIDIDGITLLEEIAKKKNFNHKKYRLDIKKASLTLLNDYRQGNLGLITLESPQSRIAMTADNQIT